MFRFVEGFSRVKKCSLPGRGLMQLDVKAVWARVSRALVTSYVPLHRLPLSELMCAPTTALSALRVEGGSSVVGMCVGLTCFCFFAS